ncbi:unnamed protein product [Cunninghamella blakesleeana]
MFSLSKSVSIGLAIILISIFVIHIGYEYEYELGEDDLTETFFKTEYNDENKKESTDREEEKYISYLPHSGLHNQRIALVNSILLAKALQRTLIVPELNLGTATYWRPSTLLPYRLDECGEEYYEEDDHLRQLKENNKAYWKSACFDYRHYLPMEVNTIFNMEAIAKKFDIKVIQRKDMKLDYYHRYWAIPQDESNKTLVNQIHDPDRYAYQIVDTYDNHSKKKFTKFLTQYTFNTLNQMKEKFLLFNSLFGSTRLILNNPHWHQMYQEIKEAMIVQHPWCLNTSQIITDRLGGEGNYMGVHIRMGDGIFKKMMDETMEKVRKQLIQQQQKIIAQHDNNTTTTKETPYHLDLNETIIQKINQLKAHPTERLKYCLHLQKLNYIHHQFSLIYMTTDAHSPQQTLSHLYDEFLCLFALDDFKDIVHDTLKLTPPLIDHQHVDDPIIHTTNGSIFLPLIDAEVASHASYFIPTLKSTFSAYITQRNLSIRKSFTSSTSSASAL